MHFDADDREKFLHSEGQWFTATTLLEHWRSVLDDLGQERWMGEKRVVRDGCGDESTVEEGMAG